jgi:hypothetical protein
LEHVASGPSAGTHIACGTLVQPHAQQQQPGCGDARHGVIDNSITERQSVADETPFPSGSNSTGAAVFAEPPAFSQPPQQRALPSQSPAPAEAPVETTNNAFQLQQQQEEDVGQQHAVFDEDGDADLEEGPAAALLASLRMQQAAGGTGPEEAWLSPSLPTSGGEATGAVLLAGAPGGSDGVIKYFWSKKVPRGGGC